MQCPIELDDVASAEWNFIVPHLERLGLISEIDKTALALYCSAYARWIDAEAACKKYGEVILSPNKNYPQVSPYSTIRDRAWEQVKKMLGEFGLSPAAREKLSFYADDQNEDEDKWWLAGSVWNQSA